MKTCSSCKNEFPPASFHKDKARKDGLYPQCKTCSNTAKAKSRRTMTAEAKLKWKNQIKEWRKKNPEKDRVIAKRSEHKRRLVRRGLNDSEHVELLASCENRCMICSGINKGKELHIDHDHISGSVRGLLCTKCNTGLGLFNDNEELLRRAIEYLRRGEGM